MLDPFIWIDPDRIYTFHIYNPKTERYYRIQKEGRHLNELEMKMAMEVYWEEKEYEKEISNTIIKEYAKILEN